MRRYLVGLLALAACGPAADDGTDDDTGAVVDSGDTGTDQVVLPLAGPCDDATGPEGGRVCVHSVPDEATWGSITLPGATADALRSTKYLVPVSRDEPVPTLFMDVNTYRLHAEMLAGAFPEHYAGLTPGPYLLQSLYPQGRRWYSGVVTEYLTDDAEIVYGFTVWDDPADPTSTITEADALAVFEELQPRFGLGELAFAPGSPAQLASVVAWTRGLSIYDPSGAVDVEAYTPGTAYGYVKRIRLTDLAEQEAAAAFGFTDILVLDVAPADVQRPVAGAVTGTRQADLSHLNVRSASRGTPNCYVRDAYDVFETWEGQLVELRCANGSWSVKAAGIADAQAYWDGLRPDPIVLSVPDRVTEDLPTFDEVPLADAQARRDAVATWGSKGSNLAVLYGLVDPDLQYDGFLVPFAKYVRHMETNGWTVDLGSGPATYSFQETLDAWLVDPDFTDDPLERRERLDALRLAVTAAPVDADDLADILDRIEEVFGDTTTSVRFRSSSNAEDALTFNGAGLYTSERGCPADDLDGDDVGPSHCDPSDAEERTVAAALATVWASTWKVAAYEERDWYGMDHGRVAMGILVNDRAVRERLNAVAFSGVPSVVGDDRVLVNSQIGNLEVVSNEPGVAPERVLIDTSVSPFQIQRVTASTVMPPGQVVASDGVLRRIAAVLDDLRMDYPIDEDPPEGADILLDTEWKVLEDGRLIIKQIRPYLRRAEAL